MQVGFIANLSGERTHNIIQQGFKHRGFSFIRVLQRCPEYLGHRYDAWVQDPERMMLLKHALHCASSSVL